MEMGWIVGHGHHCRWMTAWTRCLSWGIERHGISTGWLRKLKGQRQWQPQPVLGTRREESLLQATLTSIRSFYIYRQLVRMTAAGERAGLKSSIRLVSVMFGSGSSGMVKK